MCPDPRRPRFARTALLLLLALTATPAPARSPVAPPEIAHQLVSLDTQPDPILAEIRYATRQNFTGHALYPFPRLWLHQDAFNALAAVQAELAGQGLALKIYDGYRPLSVQQKMWDLIRDERYVSNPAKNRGRHTRGTAVDVTLVDRLGRELPMPSDFDDFSEKAHRDYEGATAEEKANRELLGSVMSRHGFIPYPYEWWHFDLRGWEKYPVLDISLSDLQAGTKTTLPVD